MNPQAASPLIRLAKLLASKGARPVITPERVATATIYDLHYRMLVVGLAFETHAAADKYSPMPRIQYQRLRMLQFIAMRPWLFSVIRAWSLAAKGKQGKLDEENGLRRGFISDTMHDDVMAYLVAAGTFKRAEQYVLAGPNQAVFQELQSARHQGLFDSESKVLDEMKSLSITNIMLEGW